MWLDENTLAQTVYPEDLVIRKREMTMTVWKIV